MSKGLDALNKLVSHIETEYHSDDYYECKNAKDTIEKELKEREQLLKENLVLSLKEKALEIIKNKGIDLIELRTCKKAKTYNENTKRTYCEEYTDEEFNLLKEVIL